MDDREPFLIVLTHGDEDNGVTAILAFACANAALSMNLNTTVFLTGKGIYWGKEGASVGVELLNFGKLENLINSFLNDGGHILFCNTSFKHSARYLHTDSNHLLKGIKKVTFKSVIRLARKGGSITF